MIHPETHVVTPRNGPRPAGPSDQCFYCQQALGGEHKADCVLRRKTVVVRAIMEYTIDVPESWDKDNIEFHRNDSSWCKGNGLAEIAAMKRRMDADESGDADCGCSILRYEFVRDANETDEAATAWVAANESDTQGTPP